MAPIFGGRLTFGSGQLRLPPGAVWWKSYTRYGRYVTFHLAEVAVPRDVLRKIRRLIDDLRPSPTPA